jgi:hypothetical protein
MTTQQALTFVKRHGIVLQAARGPAPSLAAEIAGRPIRGSWWAHPKSHEIFRTAQAVCAHPDVLVCKLAGGKITYVHRRLWPALVKLASRFPKERLAKVWEEHTETGAHASRSIPFPDWVPPEVQTQADRLSIQEAERSLMKLVITG